MDHEVVKKALDAIEKGDHEGAKNILKDMIAAAAAPVGDEDGSADRGAEGTAEPTTREKAEYPEVVESSADEDKDEEDEDKPEKKTERKAMRRLLRRLTGKSKMADVCDEVVTLCGVANGLKVKEQQLARDREALESVERRSLVTSLVRLGAEFPSTIWVDPLKTDALQLKPRWSNMPIADLRTLAKEQKAARGNKETPSTVQPPPGDANPEPGGQDVTLPGGKVVRLSAFQVKAANEAKCELAEYARLVAIRDGK